MAASKSATKEKKGRKGKAEMEEVAEAAVKPAKKEKKSKEGKEEKPAKKRKDVAEEEEEEEVVRKPVKKRKTAVEGEAEEKPAKKSKAKKGKAAGDSDEGGAEAAVKGVAAAAAMEEEDPMSVDNFELAEPIKSLLRSKGIAALFPIQAQTLGIAAAGQDVVGRARTGCGKTLAFVLPIVQRLMAANGGARRPYGRKPAVIVLTPTRELCNQVHADFEYIGKAGDLQTLSVYGGTPYAPQENKLRSGVDVVVGTPGRVKDHIERKSLDLSQILCVPLPSDPLTPPSACSM